MRLGGRSIFRQPCTSIRLWATACPCLYEPTTRRFLRTGNQLLYFTVVECMFSFCYSRRRNRYEVQYLVCILVGSDSTGRAGWGGGEESSEIESSESEEEDEDEEEERAGGYEQDDERKEPLKVEKILARRELPPSKWRELCKNMNTDEVRSRPALRTRSVIDS